MDLITDSVATVMLKAADEMEKRGYNNSSRLAMDGTVCVLGAIEFALGMRSDGAEDEVHDRSQDGLLRKITERLELPVPVRSFNPYSWALADWSNAADGPTVIKALRKNAHNTVS